MKESVIYNLQVPVKCGQDNKEMTFLEINSPPYGNSGQRRYRRDLKATLAFIRLEQSKETDADESSVEEIANTAEDGEIPIPPHQLLLLISGNLRGEFSKLIDNFCLHAKEFCKVGGEEPLKSGILERMEPDDVDMVFATFVANFMMPSLLRKPNGKD